MNLIELIQAEGTRRTLEKGEYVFHQGDCNTHLYFVQAGLLKAYYTDSDGKTLIKSFIQASNVIGSVNAFRNEGKCTFSLVCQEESALFEIPYGLIKHHSEKSLEIANNVIDLLMQFAMKKEQREYELLCLSAEERYRLILENTPELVSRVTQNDLAHYLGITPVGLSRIKKRVLGNNENA